MTQFRTQLAPLESLEQVLPNLVQNLSLGRAQIAIDQLHATIGAKSLDRIVFVTALESSSAENPSAAAIAIQQFDSGSSRVCDMATIIHAGLLKQTSDEKRREIIQVLSAAVDHELHRRGVRFVQWATDEWDAANRSCSRWCDGFGFHWIGTLDYMSGPAASISDSPSMARQGDSLRFEPIDWNRSGELLRFADLIEQTYAETLDCPQLATFRTAAQTLSGYQASGGFAPDFWFVVYDPREAAVGCMVLARHTPASPPNENPTPTTIEIVYMGLVPESRGMGRGKVLLQHAFDTARDASADQIILAVDRRNTPARTIYDFAGLQPMLSETVWVKSLSRVN